MLELGNGFCFEARHKRILIDDEYYFPDLVFYNRILHCSVFGLSCILVLYLNRTKVISG